VFGYDKTKNRERRSFEMADLMGFDANQVEPAKGFELIPSGDYVAVIVNSEMKTTNDGTGEYLKLEINILDGEYKGRKLWENLNLNNKSTQAVEIARGTLSAICRAVGIMRPKDSAELHNLPMRIKIAIKKDKGTGELQNKIVKFEAKNAASASPAGAGSTAGNSGAAPWKKAAS
jgi:hypothetical protein